MTKRKSTIFVGYFEKMSTPETVIFKDQYPKKRAIVTLTTEDGQKAYFEVREAIIARIEKLGIREGDQVEVGFVFIGSEKNNKIYNNLFINEIDYVS